MNAAALRTLDDAEARAKVVQRLVGERDQYLIILLANGIRELDDTIEYLTAQDLPDKDTLVARASQLRDWSFALMQEINPEQAWFWSREWRAGEREADRQIAEGKGTIYLTDEEFELALRERMHVS